MRFSWFLANTSKLVITSFFASIFLLNGMAVASDTFNAGRIIDDEIFYDRGAMGSAQNVQQFITNHTPACDTWGAQPSGYGNLTRAQYATQIMGWHGPPYACLQNYHENPSTGETSFERGGGAFPGGVSAGQIIWDAAQRYSINPQVLLVTLRKESMGPLFSDSWPLKKQYTYAMGYGCPDSGPNYSANCQRDQAGFYKQVDRAAKQLRMYRDNITSYNYQPGRVNRILYNPNPACGYKDVYIENYATASLYIYTPYTPNDAALAAFPGTAHCGAYGNRNFWFMFKEWFGSTTLQQLVRTRENPQVYLISDNRKYPVNSYDALERLRPVSGGVGFVSQSLIDSKQTGPEFRKMIRDPNTGDIFLVDSGYKLKFTSCELVADYRGDCNKIPDLSSHQISRFSTGPTVTRLYQTLEGNIFYIDQGLRRQVLDDQSLVEAGIFVRRNIISEKGIVDIPYGRPIIKDNTLLKDDKSGDIYYYYYNKKHYLTDFFYNQFFQKLSLGSLRTQSLNQVKGGAHFKGLVQVKDTPYIVTPAGKIRAGALPVKGVYEHIDPRLGAIIPDLDVVQQPLLKGVSSPSVYAAVGGSLYHVRSWSDLESADIAGGVTSLQNSTLSTMTISSEPFLPPGTLIGSKDSAKLYVMDGVMNSRRYVPSFSILDGLGLSRIRYVSTDLINNTKDAGALQEAMRCNVRHFFITKNGVFSVDIQTYALVSSDFSEMSQLLCNALVQKVEKNTKFIGSTSTGKIYHLKNGTKQYISGMQEYEKLGGSNYNTAWISDKMISEFRS